MTGVQTCALPISSGEDFSGDWGERHDGELGAEGQAQQTSGEPDAAQEQPVQYLSLIHI